MEVVAKLQSEYQSNRKVDFQNESRDRCDAFESIVRENFFFFFFFFFFSLLFFPLKKRSRRQSMTSFSGAMETAMEQSDSESGDQ
jgi:hypothetical protein